MKTMVSIIRFTLIVLVSLYLSACASTSVPAANTKISSDTNVEKLALTPEQLQATINLADQAYTARNWPEAFNLYKKVYDAGTKSNKVLLRLANTSVFANNLENAQLYYIQLLKVDPSNTKAQYNLATVYLTKAEEHFQFYIATLNESATDPKLLELLLEIDKFSNKNKQLSPNKDTPLDNLRQMLEYQ